MMLDAGKTPAFYDVLKVEDPDFHQTEVLADAIITILYQTNHHAVVRIGALAAVIIANLLNAPPQHRTALTDSLLDDIRQKVAEGPVLDA